METILLLVQTWWWAAPAAAGAGAATYVGITARGRRARRLELDASRREVSVAYRALISARARVREAQAEVLSARAASAGPVLGGVLSGGPATAEARRQLQEAKRSEKSAVLVLRARRARVKATTAHYRAASTADPLPIERLFVAHDAVVARWMSYETDVAQVIAYPQLSDARHPATAAFYRAHRDAQRLRPESARGRIPPEQFLEYRDAVQALGAAFDEAERQAGAAATRPPTQRPIVWPVPARRPPRLPASE